MHPVEHYLEKASSLRRKGEYRKAIKFYTRILSSLRKPQNNPLIERIKAESFIGKADLLRIKGDFKDAVKNYISARRIGSKNFIAESTSEGKSFWQDVIFESSLGVALADKAAGRYKLALKKLKYLLRLSRTRKDFEAEGFILWHIGMLLRFMGNPYKGLSAIKSALRIFEKINSSDGKGFCLCALGGILRVTGRPRESLENYRKAGAIFSRIGDGYGRAYSFCGQANALKTLGRWQDALKLYRRSEKIYKKTGDISSLAFVYKGIAGCYWGKIIRANSCPETEFAKDIRRRKNFRIKHLSTRLPSLFRRYYHLAEKFFVKSGDRRGLLLLRKEFPRI